MGRSVDEELFEAEQKVLQSAMDDLANQRHSGNELLGPYRFLAENYKKLLRVTRKVFYISDSQGQILQRQQREMQNLLDNANQGFLTFGRNLLVNRQYSAECARIFEKKISGIPITHLLGQGNAILQEKLRKAFLEVFTSSQGSEQAELQQFPTVFQIKEKDIRVECKLIPQPDEATERTVVMIILTDITERLKAEEQIHYLSYHDKLTSLYNRAYVDTVLPELEKPESLPLSIIVADMNGLKLINDVFGHEQGDFQLVAMAKVLKQSCRLTDIIARWGGDEFVVLLPKMDLENGKKVCERIRNACVEIVDCAIPLSAAVGLATKDTEGAQLNEIFSVAENKMYNDKLLKSKRVREDIVDSLESRLASHCFVDKDHCERVMNLALDFTAFLGVRTYNVDVAALTQLAKLHDIGKVALPAEILGSKEPLSDNEWDIVKSHSEIGYRMAQSISEQTVAEIILALHERWDGFGYPFGLKEEQIPVLARIFSIVDVYDVITHDRPYRKALDEENALREIAAGMGTQFDPEITRSFIEYKTNR